MEERTLGSYIEELGLKKESNCLHMDKVEDATFFIQLKAITIDASNAKTISDGIRNGEDELDFISKVILKRIEFLENNGYIEKDYIPVWIGVLSTLLGVNNPAKAVIFLIECLEAKDKNPDVDFFSEVYPFGFYDEETFNKILDEVIKDKNKHFKFKFLY